jgi:hypothetical protein
MAVKKRLQAATIRAGLLLIVLTHIFDAKCVEGATVNNGGIESNRRVSCSRRLGSNVALSCYWLRPPRSWLCRWLGKVS